MSVLLIKVYEKNFFLLHYYYVCIMLWCYVVIFLLYGTHVQLYSVQ